MKECCAVLSFRYICFGKAVLIMSEYSRFFVTEALNAYQII
jgi:hypothetical protein